MNYTCTIFHICLHDTHKNIFYIAASCYKSLYGVNSKIESEHESNHIPWQPLQLQLVDLVIVVSIAMVHANIF